MTSPIEGYRLSPQQRHLWGLMAEGRSESYEVRCTIDIAEPCEPARLRAALKRLVARHEILRTTFRRPPGVDVPVQLISQDASRFGFTVHDLGGLPAGERRERHAVLAGQWRATPLDLENGPVVSAALIRPGESQDSQARLFFKMPALCADEASLSILAGELFQDLSGQGVLVQEPLQYADFAQWQQDLLTEPDFELEREYWRGRNPADLARPRLPFGAAGGDHPPFRPAVVRRCLPQNLRSALHHLAQRLEVAPSTVVLAAWRLLLDRMTDGQRFAVDVRFGNRGAEELRSAVGLLAQYLPAVSAPEPGEGLAGFLQRLQAELDLMSQYQAFSGREHLEPRPAQAGGSFGAGFDWNEGKGHAGVSGAGRFRLTATEAVTERFQVRLSGRDENGSLWLDLWYDAGSLGPAQACLLVGQLVAILQAAAADPAAPLHALAAVEAEEGDGAPAPARGGLYTAASPVHVQFAKAARRWPDRVAMRYGERALTYGALDAQANRLANHLRKFGVTADRPVGVCLGRSLAQLVAMMGVLKAGGAFVMVDPSSPPERRARMLAAVGAQVVVTVGKFAGTLAGAGRVVIALDDDAETIAAQPAAEPGDPGISDDRLAYTVFTSGSTGTPKAVCLSHRNLAEYTSGLDNILRLPSGAGFGLVSSMAVDLGYTSVFPALCSGGVVHVVPEECVTDPLELMRYFRRFPVDCLKITPSHLRALLGSGDPAGVLPSRVLVIGGEPLDWELVDRVREAAPSCRVVNHYGPAETTVGVLACETDP